LPEVFEILTLDFVFKILVFTILINFRDFHLIYLNRNFIKKNDSKSEQEKKPVDLKDNDEKILSFNAAPNSSLIFPQF